MDDTICAISTALGVGGISIIRVSGKDAINIVNSIFDGKNLKTCKTHTIHYGHIVYNDEIIDEALVSIMLAPKTYTAEDVVEINSHGGIATTNKILEILLNSGCRQAEPGEFTKRAFLNGRIDLIEAESVADVINAETESARTLSVNNLDGNLSKIIKQIKNEILELEANIEVNLDYPEYDDIEDMTNEKVKTKLEEIIVKFEKLIRESKTGKIINNGANIAIIGSPNVGKSSLLNSLLEENRAIVTNIPGTTRDTVEGKMNLNGLLINFIDTAGIRNTDDAVEKIGVDKAKEEISKSDLVIMVLDGSRKVNDDERKIIDEVEKKNHIYFINKSDLPKKIDLTLENSIFGSVLNNEGLEELKNRIYNSFIKGDILNKDMTYVSNARQLSLIKKANDSIKSALEGTKNNVPVDIIEIDLDNAKNYLGDILGDNYNDELLDELFSRFCIGK